MFGVALVYLLDIMGSYSATCMGISSVQNKGYNSVVQNNKQLRQYYSCYCKKVATFITAHLLSGLLKTL